MSKSRFMWMCNAKKSRQVPPGRPNFFGCEMKKNLVLCPDFSKNPEVRCREIRASTSRASKFVRLRNEEKSGFALVACC